MTNVFLFIILLCADTSTKNNSFELVSNIALTPVTSKIVTKTFKEFCKQFFCQLGVKSVCFAILYSFKLKFRLSPRSRFNHTSKIALSLFKDYISQTLVDKLHSFRLKTIQWMLKVFCIFCFYACCALNVWNVCKCCLCRIYL